jgi:multidrug resistance efflux pump
LTTQ